MRPLRRRRARPGWPGGTAEEKLAAIRAAAIGDDAVLDGPFGPRRLVYADATASGRSLSFVEDLLREQVLPTYGNTHTEASATGRRTTALREEARAIVHRAVGGGPDDVVVFCGSGTTAAVDKAVRLLGLDRADPDDRPVVFIGPYEHHSNELPWRESAADVVTIAEAPDGGVDLAHLEAQLRRYAERSLKIGSFSAASNVTGQLTDVDPVAIALHRHGALSFWDYAAAGPYLPIEMNPSPDLPDGHLAYKDAVFLSPHKFPGGPGTPGVLVAKRGLLRRRVPTVPGGGTILFVSPTEQSYAPDPAIREEGGTPAIVESIRAGLVFALKETVGAEAIRRREHAMARRALASLSANPRIEILGSLSAERLAVVAFGIRCPAGLLHANFVVAVLSDLFGIQTRSGCFCAGPFIHREYPIDEEWSRRMHAEVLRGHMGAKLAFTRVSFPVYTSPAAVEYVLAAVHLVADEGWALLPHYRFDRGTGLWHHREAEPAVPSLLAAAGPFPRAAEWVLPAQLAAARRVLRAARERPVPPPEPPPFDEEFERARWFALPGADGATEAVRLQLSGSSSP